jgi:hypothetical protein
MLAAVGVFSSGWGAGRRVVESGAQVAVRRWQRRVRAGGGLRDRRSRAARTLLRREHVTGYEASVSRGPRARTSAMQPREEVEATGGRRNDERGRRRAVARVYKQEIQMKDVVVRKGALQ